MRMEMIQYFTRIGIALSVLFNVIWFGVSNQTFSARNWQLYRNGKTNMVSTIDLMAMTIGRMMKKSLTFFFGKDMIKFDLSNHCMEAWVYWKVAKEANRSSELKDSIEDKEHAKE